MQRNEFNVFDPEWTCPPGYSVQSILEERGMTKVELAQRLGYSRKFVHDLLSGRAEVGRAVAERLSRVIGHTPEYWLRYELEYRSQLRRNAEADDLAKSEPAWLSELPRHSWLVRYGFADEKTKKGSKMLDFLSFFSVGTIQAWRRAYLPTEVFFRASYKADAMPGAVAVWLRACEIEADKVDCAPFDRVGFSSFLENGLRGLTLIESAEEAAQRLQEICAPFGVAVVTFPRPNKCPVSGATWWMNPHKVIIGLSLRFKTSDHFWFSFAHEAGHVLKHSKKERHIAFDGRKDDEENEANAFARDLLIPPELAIEIPKLKTAEDFVAFAERVGVAPGVVVGRAQHDGFQVFERNPLNRLKTSYVWRDRSVDDEPDEFEED